MKRSNTSPSHQSRKRLHGSVQPLMEALENRQMLAVGVGTWGIAESTADYLAAGDTQQALQSRAADYVLVLGGRSGGIAGPAGPTAPTHLVATQMATERIDLSWRNNWTTADAIRIERSRDGVSFSLLKTVPGNVNRYVDTALSVGNTYHYRLVAYSTTGSAAPSAVVSLAPSSNAIALSTAVEYETAVRLTWPVNPDATAGYLIERSSEGVTFAKIAQTTLAESGSYLDIGRNPGQSYYYRVKTIGSGPGVSARSNIVPIALPLAMPTELAATTVSAGEIRLTWTDTYASEDGFRLERSTDAFETIDSSVTVSRNTTSYRDVGLVPQTQYFYRISVYNPAGQSVWSEPATAWTILSTGTDGGGQHNPDPETSPDPDSATSAPDAPLNLAVVQAATERVNVTWALPAGPVDTFIIQRSRNGGNYTELARVPGTRSQHVDINVSVGTTYTYRIIAVNAAGSSAPSATATIRLSSNAVTLTVTAAGDAATLSWSNNVTTATGWIIERSTDGTTFSKVATLQGAGITSHTDTGLISGRRYYYRVKTTNTASSVAGRSNIASVTAPLPMPQKLVATALSSTTIQLKWQPAVPASIGFTIERSADGFATIDQSVDLPTTQTAYLDMNAEAGRTYAYRLRVRTASGTSIPTELAFATALPTATPRTEENSFTLYDAMSWQLKPDLSPFGLQPIYLTDREVFAGSYPNYDRTKPDEAATRALARKVAAKNQLLVLDIEHWEVNIMYAPVAEVEHNLQMLAQIVDWIKDERPEVKVGFYGILPVADYWMTADYAASLLYASTNAWWNAMLPKARAKYEAMQAANDLVASFLASKVDFLCPSFYTFYDDPHGWQAVSTMRISEAKRFGKPVLPFLWMQYHEGGPEREHTLYLPADYWNLQLETVFAHADGAVIWGGWGGTWDESAPWWQITSEFLLALE